MVFTSEVVLRVLASESLWYENSAAVAAFQSDSKPRNTIHTPDVQVTGASSKAIITSSLNTKQNKGLSVIAPFAEASPGGGVKKTPRAFAKKTGSSAALSATARNLLQPVSAFFPIFLKFITCRNPTAFFPADCVSRLTKAVPQRTRSRLPWSTRTPPFLRIRSTGWTSCLCCRTSSSLPSQSTASKSSALFVCYGSSRSVVVSTPPRC